MIGIVTGLTAEAALAAPLGIARAGGGTPRGAAHAAEQLVREGATALISFGLAGGLNPALPPGTLVVPASVITPSRTYPTDPALCARLGGPRHTLFAGVILAVTKAEKSSLHEAFQADAIDLESGAVAAVAAAHNLPFAVLRAICDSSETSLAPAPVTALSATGAIAPLRVAASLLAHPGQISALIRLARDAAAARRALAREVKKGLLF